MTEKEWRTRLKEAHLCRNCKQQDAYTLGGRTYCAECAAKEAERKRRWRAADGGEANRRGNVRWKEHMLAEGRCIYCGRVKPDDGRKTCAWCLRKMSAKRRDRMVQTGMNWPRGSNGLCYQCNKREVVKGKRLCAECMAVKLVSLGV